MSKLQDVYEALKTTGKAELIPTVNELWTQSNDLFHQVAQVRYHSDDKLRQSPDPEPYSDRRGVKACD